MNLDRLIPYAGVKAHRNNISIVTTIYSYSLLWVILIRYGRAYSTNISLNSTEDDNYFKVPGYSMFVAKVISF